MLIFTATASVLFGLKSAPGAFAAGEGFVISDSTSPTIFSSRVGADMVPALEGVPGITGASPEVFAFSTFNGVSFVVRGVDLERLNRTGPAFKEFTLANGQSTSGSNSALVGDRLLSRLGIEPPYLLPLVGSYASRLELVNVVGSFSTDSALDDEILVPLDVARYLSGTAVDKVSIIRVAADDPAWLADLLSPSYARFTLFDLHTSKARAAVGEEVSLSVGVRNWGGAAGVIEVRFSEGQTVLDEVDVALGASETTTVTRSFTFEQLGQKSVQVSISGDFPVTLHANFTVVEPYLRLTAPTRVLLGKSFDVTATKSSGEPAEGAHITFMTQSALADPSGNASLFASELGTWTARASMQGFTDATASVEVRDPSAFPAEFLPSVVDFSVLPETIKESEHATGLLSITNGGSVAGRFQMQILIDSQVYSTLEIDLAGMSSETVRFEISGILPGTHVVHAGSFSRALVVDPWMADNPDLVQLVLRYGGTASLSPSASIPIYQAAKLSEGNVSVALFAIGAISALLAALAIASVYSKEVHESRRTLGILRTLGASGDAVRALVFPQALRSGLSGAAIGVGAGVIAAHTLSVSGAFMVFGHTLVLRLDAGLLLLVFISSVAIAVATSLWCAMMASQESAIASIRGFEEDSEPARTGDLVSDD